MTGVSLLGYPDGALDEVDPVEAVTVLVGHLRRVRPQVVVTFDPSGAYGHPDHVAICQLTTAAVARAGEASASPGSDPPHQVSKLYYMAWPPSKWAAYQAALKRLVSTVDGVERQASPGRTGPSPP